MKSVVTVLICAFIALAVVGKIHCEMSYRYRVTVPDGKYSMSYYTDAYAKRNGCVRFREGHSFDSTEVCGMYTISQLR